MRRPAGKPQWTAFRSVLADQIRAFLEAKRALGRKYETEDRTLRLLDEFLVERGVKTIGAVDVETIDVFLKSRARTGPRSYNSLLGITGRFFRWLVTHRVISSTPVRARSRREVQGRLAYIFDAPAARKLLDVAARLPDNSRGELRGPTFRAIFALLYGLGLRVSEAAHLTVADVDLERAVLTVRGAKFGKTRLVPFGPRMASMLRSYVALKFGSAGAPSSSSWLFSFGNARKAIATNTIRNVFREDILPELDIVCPKGTTRPRVHDLRHSFAVGTLLRWYRSGVRPADRLDRLSVFMGHARPQATAVYLTVTAELLASANERFERYARPALDVEALR